MWSVPFPFDRRRQSLLQVSLRLLKDKEVQVLDVYEAAYDIQLIASKDHVLQIDTVRLIGPLIQIEFLSEQFRRNVI